MTSQKETNKLFPFFGLGLNNIYLACAVCQHVLEAYADQLDYKFFESSLSDFYVSGKPPVSDSHCPWYGNNCTYV